MAHIVHQYKIRISSAGCWCPWKSQAHPRVSTESHGFQKETAGLPLD